MVPVGVKPGRRLVRSCVTPVSFDCRCQASRSEEWLAGGSQIIYDFRYDARARELMTNFDGCRSRPIRAPLAGAPGQDHRDPPELRVARRSARPPPGRPVVLLQAVELGRGIRRHDRAPRRHRAARVRGRDRARHRHAGPPRLARGRVEPRRLGHRGQRLRPLRPARERQGLQRALEGRRRVHADRADAASTPRASTRPRCGCARGSTASSRRTTRPRGCIFPLAQLVADLSQHFTLEPGDVILTGTPAGSSVVVPGDVVEVEVDAPRARAADSGRLVTTVTQGAASFDESLGSLPAVDDTQRAEAWGSREAAGLPTQEMRRPQEIRRRSSYPGAAPDSAPAASSPRRCATSSLRAPVAGLSRAAAQARAEQRHDRRRAADAPRREARRHREDAALRARSRGPVRVARRRLQRAEARVRRGRRGRGHRDRGARRDRLRHARRHPRAPRARPRRRRHRHRRRSPRLRRGRRDRHPGVLRRRAPRGARPQARAVGRRRDDRMRRHDRAAGRRHRRRRATASSSSRPRSPRRSSTRPSPRRTRTPGSPSRSRRGIPSTASSR